MWRAGALWALIAGLGAGAGCGDANVDSPFNRPPRAWAEQAIRAEWGVAEFVSVSTDPDGDLLSHHWTITRAPEGSLLLGAQGDGETFEFAMDVPGYYQVELFVSDGEYASRAPSGLWLP